MQAYPRQKVQQSPQNEDQLRILQCHIHRNPFLYVCNAPECNQLLCGRIECVDLHFHGKALFISRIDPRQLRQHFDLFCCAQKRVQCYKSTLEHIQSEVNSLKLRNNCIFQKRKRAQQICQQLSSESSGSLNDRFLHSLEEIHQAGEEMEAEVRGLSEQLKWEVIWIGVRSEAEMKLKLKLEFQELRYLSFTKIPTSQHQFRNRWAEVDGPSFDHEGIVTLLFTKERLVVGEFLANSNVETAKLFLNSFLFIVDAKGTLRKTIVSHSVLALASSGSAVQLYFDQEDPAIAEIKKHSEIGECLQVERMEGFLAAGN